MYYKSYPCLSLVGNIPKKRKYIDIHVLSHQSSFNLLSFLLFCRGQRGMLNVTGLDSMPFLQSILLTRWHPCTKKVIHVLKTGLWVAGDWKRKIYLHCNHASFSGFVWQEKTNFPSERNKSLSNNLVPHAWSFTGSNISDTSKLSEALHNRYLASLVFEQSAVWAKAQQRSIFLSPREGFTADFQTSV